ncbi:MAG: pseudouridine synthase [Rhodospirillaceae bacterium]
MSADQASTDAQPTGDRIAKVMARAGLCSRRDAERWIAEGRVVVNGRIIETPATLVTADDMVLVDGNPLPGPQRTRLWRYHKPVGLMTTHKDPEGRPTVFERLPPDLPRVISVGRLDLNSEGLLLLTTDGGLARDLELPSRGWLRRYRVRVHGRPDQTRLSSLEKGVRVEGVDYGPIKAVLEREQGANAWLSVSLTEGRNREIRRVMEHLGLPVSRLIRVAYGPFQLGTLTSGAAQEVTGKVLREQLGVGSAAPVKRARSRKGGAGA